MPVINGDKSRFNREGRKQIANPARERLKDCGVQPKPVVSQLGLRQKEASA